VKNPCLHASHPVQSEKQHTPILTGLRALEADRGWEVEIVPLVAGQRSVREKEWLESLKVFGIVKEDGNKIIHRLGYTLFNEHEKLFDSSWRHLFGASSSLSECERHIGPCLPVSPGRVRAGEKIQKYNKGDTLVVNYLPVSQDISS
jgi:hypothetical protein